MYCTNLVDDLLPEPACRILVSLGGVESDAVLVELLAGVLQIYTVILVSPYCNLLVTGYFFNIQDVEVG